MTQDQQFIVLLVVTLIILIGMTIYEWTRDKAD